MELSGNMLKYYDDPHNVWYTYKPLTAHKKFHADPAFSVLLMGGLGSGKSYAACKHVMYLASLKGGMRVALARKELKALRLTTLKTFEAAMDPVRDWWLLDWNKSDGILKVRANDGGESEIILLDMDDEVRIRSAEYSAAFIDEAGGARHGTSTTDSGIRQNVFMHLLGRLRLAGAPYYKVLLATNPVSKSHWLHEVFVEQTNADYSVHHSSIYDNKYLTKDYIKQCEAQFIGSRRTTFLMGQWGSDTVSNSIYGDFNPDLHVISLQPNPTLPLYVGLDQGYTAPTAVFAQVSKNGRLCVIDAIQGEKISTVNFIEVLKSKINSIKHNGEVIYYGDIAHKQTSFSGESAYSEYVNAGIHMKMSAQTLEKGHDLIRTKLSTLIDGYPSLVVSNENNQKFLDSWTEYRYQDRINQGKNDPEPVNDRNKDYHDALRYMAWGLFNNKAFTDRKEADRDALMKRLIHNKKKRQYA